MREYNPKTEPNRDDRSLGAMVSAVHEPGEKMKILIADSDLGVCHSLEMLLSGLDDVIVECFHDAQSLLDYDYTDDVACLITEVDLPDLNGVELLEKLNARGVFVPTIILAACSDVPTAVRAMQAKAKDFMEKPFVEGLMFKRVKQILQQHMEECVA